MSGKAFPATDLIDSLEARRKLIVDSRTRLLKTERDVADLIGPADQAIDLLTYMLHSLELRGARNQPGMVQMRSHEVRALASVVLVSRALEHFASRSETAPSTKCFT